MLFCVLMHIWKPMVLFRPWILWGSRQGKIKDQSSQSTKLTRCCGRCNPRLTCEDHFWWISKLNHSLLSLIDLVLKGMARVKMGWRRVEQTHSLFIINSVSLYARDKHLITRKETTHHYNFIFIPGMGRNITRLKKQKLCFINYDSFFTDDSASSQSEIFKLLLTVFALFDCLWITAFWTDKRLI